MKSNKRHWFWNLLLVLTVIVCAFALTMHYKNWVSVKSNYIKVMSGFYSQSVDYNDLDSVVFVARLPPMERLNGFSALEKEKGVFREFKDSLTDKKVYVFVDNISQQKIKLVYKDSVKLYLNLKDSVKTLNLFNSLVPKLRGEIDAPN
ncbi:MAG: flagellar motor component MotA [Maribacter sp.]|jgi:flagellar motor component MotA